VQAWITQFRKGLVELCVMAALRDEEAYGYQIVEKLGQIPGLEVTESTVYPVLARLARVQAPACISQMPFCEVSSWSLTKIRRMAGVSFSVGVWPSRPRAGWRR
jgi:hypothetical protein